MNKKNDSYIVYKFQLNNHDSIIKTEDIPEKHRDTIRDEMIQIAQECCECFTTNNFVIYDGYYSFYMFFKADDRKPIVNHSSPLSYFTSFCTRNFYARNVFKFEPELSVNTMLFIGAMTNYIGLTGMERTLKSLFEASSTGIIFTKDFAKQIRLSAFSEEDFIKHACSLLEEKEKEE